MSASTAKSPGARFPATRRFRRRSLRSGAAAGSCSLPMLLKWCACLRTRPAVRCPRLGVPVLAQRQLLLRLMAQGAGKVVAEQNQLLPLLGRTGPGSATDVRPTPSRAWVRASSIWRRGPLTNPAATPSRAWVWLGLVGLSSQAVPVRSKSPTNRAPIDSSAPSEPPTAFAATDAPNWWIATKTPAPDARAMCSSTVP